MNVSRVGIGELCSIVALLCYASNASNILLLCSQLCLLHGLCACVMEICTASSSTSDSDTDSNANPPTILNCLKPPQKSDLLRKRKIERPKTTDADKKTEEWRA